MVAIKASDLIVGAGGDRKGGKTGDGKKGADGGGNEGRASEDWTRFGKKQILSVGKKRRHHHDDAEDDELANEAANGGDESSDEEEGRTSAVKEKKRRVRPAPTTAPAAPAGGAQKSGAEGASLSAEGAGAEAKRKKKKKKGKKERLKDGATMNEVSKGAASDAPTFNSEEPNENKAAGEGKSKDEAANSAIDKSGTPTSDANPKPKRKRKKVRSRQKNIRKDHRSTEAKPAHLVAGGAEYRGRPLTTETRKKLGLDASHGAAQDGDALGRASMVDDAFDSGEWVGGDESPSNIPSRKAGGVAAKEGEDGGAIDSKQKAGVDEGKVLTKIGDCVVGGEAATSVDAKKSGAADGKKQKKRKRKFKNL